MKRCPIISFVSEKVADVKESKSYLPLWLILAGILIFAALTTLLDIPLYKGRVIFRFPEYVLSVLAFFLAFFTALFVVRYERLFLTTALLLFFNFILIQIDFGITPFKFFIISICVSAIIISITACWPHRRPYLVPDRPAFRRIRKKSRHKKQKAR
jgi:hypothetical protein